MGQIEKLTPPVAEPIFTSAHSALMFAMNFSHGTLKKNALDQAVRDGGRGLSGLDGAAQAGMILAELSRLTGLRQHILTARYTVATSPCTCRSPCCSGEMENVAWKESIDWLAEYVLVAGLTGTISHFRLRRCIIRRYFGVKDPLVSIANACGVHRHTAENHNKAVVEHLRGEERPAFHELQDQLEAVGIVAT